MTLEEKQRCGTCRFWFKANTIDLNGVGLCRGGPPCIVQIQKRTPQGIAAMEINAQFPPMPPNDPGCGAYQPREEWQNAEDSE